MRLQNVLKRFFRRQSVVPFETMFAFYCIYSGIAGLVSFGVTNDIFKTVIGATLANIFNIIYILAGAGMYFGIGLKRGDIEGFGLITILTSVIIRMIAFVWVVIANPGMLLPKDSSNVSIIPSLINFCAFSLVFITACLVRLSYILKGEVIMTLKDIEVRHE